VEVEVVRSDDLVYADEIMVIDGIDGFAG